MLAELLIKNSLIGELPFLLESIFIFEGRIDFLKDKHKDGIDSSHDTLAKHREPHDIIDHFASNADPSKKKIYTQKIVDWYKNKDFRQEDHGRVRQTLKDFESNKKKLPHSDIGKYKSFHHLNSALADFKPKQTNMDWGEFSQDDLNHLNGEGSTVIHDEPKYTVREVHDQRAMDILGKGAEWCIVSNKHRGSPAEGVGENSSLFDNYKERHPGSKFFHVHDKETGERFLNHYESEQHFFNEKNREQGRKHEVTSKYQEGMAKTLGHLKSIEKAKSPFTGQKDLHAMHTDGDENIRRSVARHLNTHPDTLHALHTDGDQGVRASVASNPNTRHDIIHALHTDEKEVVKASVAFNPNAHHDILHALHTDGSGWVRENVARNLNTHHDTLHALHTDPHKDVKRNVAENPNTRSDTLHILRTDDDWVVRNAAKEALKKRGLL